MAQNAIRMALIAIVLGFAVVSIGVGPKTYGKGDQIQLISFAWGIDESQLMRICIGNGVGSPDSDVALVDNFSLNFAEIKFESGVTAHETELQVPFGQFRCRDLSYQSLVSAGLPPQSNSALQFFVNIRTRSSTTVGATQAVSVGAAQNIDVATGQIKLSHPFTVGQTR